MPEGAVTIGCVREVLQEVNRWLLVEESPNGAFQTSQGQRPWASSNQGDGALRGRSFREAKVKSETSLRRPFRPWHVVAMGAPPG
jgi:hypothetical protein